MDELYKPSILVAEDIEINYKLFEAYLHKFYKLDWAHDGAQAVEMFKSKSYDLILMDMKMPVMDGVEATRLIRKISSVVPIIAQTAFSFNEERRMCQNAGCTDFIEKPIHWGRLRSIIDKHILTK